MDANAPSRILPRIVFPIILLTLVFVVIPGALSLTGQGYLTRLAHVCLIYVILAVSMNFMTGTGGFLSLGHAAFYSIGAYVAALLSTRWNIPFLPGLLLGGLGAAVVGFFLGMVTARLVSVFFAVATLAVGEIVNLVLMNWFELTQGPMGIRGIPPFEVLGYDLSSPIASYYVIAVVTVASVWIIHRLTHSYYGNAVRAMREDEDGAEAMGVNITWLKIQVITLSCFFPGLAGALLAYNTTYVSPDMFQLGESFLILTMVVVGGLGSIPGVVIGALILILVPEFAREIGEFRMMAVGILLYVSILLMPKGLFGEISALYLIRRQFGVVPRGADKVLSW